MPHQKLGNLVGVKPVGVDVLHFVRELLERVSCVFETDSDSAELGTHQLSLLSDKRTGQSSGAAVKVAVLAHSDNGNQRRQAVHLSEQTMPPKTERA